MIQPFSFTRSKLICKQRKSIWQILQSSAVMGEENMHVCVRVFVKGGGGLMTLHRPLILRERVIIAIKPG